MINRGVAVRETQRASDQRRVAVIVTIGVTRCSNNGIASRNSTAIPGFFGILDAWPSSPGRFEDSVTWWRKPTIDADLPTTILTAHRHLRHDLPAGGRIVPAGAGGLLEVPLRCWRWSVWAPWFRDRLLGYRPVLRHQLGVDQHDDGQQVVYSQRGLIPRQFGTVRRRRTPWVAIVFTTCSRSAWSVRWTSDRSAVHLTAAAHRVRDRNVRPGTRRRRWSTGISARPRRFPSWAR